MPAPDVLLKYLAGKAQPPAFAMVVFVIPEDHNDTQTAELWEYHQLVGLN